MNLSLPIPSPSHPSDWQEFGPLHVRLTTHHHRNTLILTVFLVRRSALSTSLSLYIHIPLTNLPPVQNLHTSNISAAVHRKLPAKTASATLSLRVPPSASLVQLNICMPPSVSSSKYDFTTTLTASKPPSSSPAFTLSHLFADPAFKDLTLVSSDGTPTLVHSAVIAAASPVFSAMLQTQMLESRTRRINLPHVSLCTTEASIRFIYGLLPQIPPELAASLYQFGHQYDVQPLLIASRDCLLHLLQENLFDSIVLLRFSNLYSDSILHQAASTAAAHSFGTISAASLQSLPTETFYELLESEQLRALEVDVLLQTMRWAMGRSHTHLMGALRRIRWGLMDETGKDIERILMERVVPGFQKRIGSLPAKRRIYGKPDCVVVVGVVRRTKAGRENVEKVFWKDGLEWGVRIGVGWCSGDKCGGGEVGLGLWLGENREGQVTVNGKDILPLRAVVRLGVWEGGGRGGWLGGRTLDVVLHRGGWGGGWSVGDLVEHQLRSKAVRVSIEVCKVTTVSETGKLRY